MTPRAEQVLASAMELDEAERADIADRLAQTVSSPLDDPEWGAEIARRIADLRSGKSPGVPADEAFRRVEDEFGTGR